MRGNFFIPSPTANLVGVAKKTKKICCFEHHFFSLCRFSTSRKALQSSQGKGVPRSPFSGLGTFYFKCVIVGMLNGLLSNYWLRLSLAEVYSWDHK